MRKETLIRSLLASSLFLTVFAGGALAQTMTLQDLGVRAFKALPKVTIYTAKKIITMDPQNPEATAVAVVGDRILAVGSLKKLEQAAAGQPYTVNKTFADRILVPGFIAQHLHPFLSAATMRTWKRGQDSLFGLGGR